MRCTVYINIYIWLMVMQVNIYVHWVYILAFTLYNLHVKLLSYMKLSASCSGSCPSSH